MRTLKSVASLVDEYEARAAFATDIRNRHIAHRNAALALNHQSFSLHWKPCAVRAALRSPRSATERDRLSSRARREVVYDIVSLSGDGEALLHVLRDGLNECAPARAAIVEDSGPDDWKSEPADGG
jgi:hypothetical protein